MHTQLVSPWDRVFRAKTEDEREEAMKQMLAAVDALEGALKEGRPRPFFGGDSVGYVDVVLGGAVSYAKGHDALFGSELIDAAKTPLLAAWMERFCELDAAKAVLQDVDRVVQYGKMLIAKNAAATRQA
jgi:glutathione S-transferase